MRVPLFILFCAAIAFAHPHVFVDAKVKFLFDDSGLKSVHNTWVYDELYSAAMLASVDKNSDTKLSKDEQNKLQNIILEPLKKHNYFNYLQVKTEFLKAGKISNFKASLNAQKKLTLDFDIEFLVPVEKEYTMLVLVIADPSNYIQMNADMEKTDVLAPEKIDVEYFADVVEGLTLFKAFMSGTEGLYLRFLKI